MNKKALTLDSLGDIKKPARKEHAEEPIKRNNRRKKRSPRILQLNLKVTSEFYEKLCHQADKDGDFLVEVLEKALDLYTSTPT